MLLNMVICLFEIIKKIDPKKKFMVPRGLSIWGALFEEEKILNWISNYAPDQLISISKE